MPSTPEKDPQEPQAPPTADGSTSGRLRRVAEAQTSRRHMLRRGGVAAAATVAGLTLLDQRRAEASNGTAFTLGVANDANNTTELHPTTTGQLETPMFHLNGANLSGTSTTAQVTGPNAGQSLALVVNNGGGGLALQVNAASTSTTTGLAIQANGSGATPAVVGSSGSATGVTGNSGSGIGVAGNSTSGTGVKATSASGTALSVVGRAHFSRSGAASVSQGAKTKTVTVSGMKSTSLVLVTLQTSISGVYVAAAVPAAGKFTVHLNKSTPTAAKFAWFVLN